LKRCKQVLDEIATLLKGFKASNSGSPAPLKDRIKKLPTKEQNVTSSHAPGTAPNKASFKDRIAWALLKKKRAGELVSQLEQCKSTLALAFAHELLYQSLHMYA
jgi:hypothetical protein